MKLKIVLDNIRSAWNVGAIMRTCDALGADLILVGYTPKPIGQSLNLIKKTAIGAENTVHWQHFTHFQEVFDKYPNQNYRNYHFAIELSDNSQSIFEYLSKNGQDLMNKNLFLWFGNEIHGVSEDLQINMKAILHLPMNGSKESLNVSSCVCATGYLFLSTKVV